MGQWERMNTHDSKSVELDFMGEVLRLSQDCNTEHLGTSVWDASIVLAKYLEKNMRKGLFARSKVAGKRVLELGSGMGLGGIAMSLMGANVTLTDTKEVLPLLRRNCELNLGKGKAHICELDWLQPEQVAHLEVPFDIVIATDCVYHEHIVPHFHAIVMATTNEKSTVLIVNELRSHSVHAAFMAAFTPTHHVTLLPSKHMHDTYQHENIQVFLCKKKKPSGAKGGASAEEGQGGKDSLQQGQLEEGVQGTVPVQPGSGQQGRVEPEGVQHQHQQQRQQRQESQESSQHSGDCYLGHDSRSRDRDCSEAGPAEANQTPHSASEGDASTAGAAAAEQWAARRTGAAIAQMLGGVKVPS